MSGSSATFPEMAAVAWTAIGLLAATLFGTPYYLGARLDALGARIDALGARLDARIDALDSRLTSAIDGISNRLDTHVERHAG